MKIFLKISFWIMTILILAIALPFFPSIPSILLILVALLLVPLKRVEAVRARIFARKKEPIETNTKNTPTFTQRQIQNVQLDLGDIRPNEYGNYLYTPSAIFTVHGTNPKTGRKNKRVYEAANASDAEAQATENGLAPPFEISWEPAGGPSERQESYARDVGVIIPPGACSTDVSALLSRYEEDDYKAATPGFLEYIASKGWRGSALIGYNAMFKPVLDKTYVFEQEMEEREKIALFAYCAVKERKGEPVGNLLTDQNKEQYFDFADRVLEDEKLLASFRRLDISQYYAPEKRTAIYQATRILK